jgi:hypothetical protein
MSPGPATPGEGLAVCTHEDIDPDGFADRLWIGGHYRLAQIVETVLALRDGPKWLLLTPQQQTQLGAEDPSGWRTLKQWLWHAGHYRCRLIDEPVQGSEAETVTIAFAREVPAIPLRLRPAHHALLDIALRDGRLMIQPDVDDAALLELETETLVPAWWPHIDRSSTTMAPIQRAAYFRMMFDIRLHLASSEHYRAHMAAGRPADEWSPNESEIALRALRRLRDFISR